MEDVVMMSRPSLGARVRWRLRAVSRAAVGVVDSVFRRLGYVRMERDCVYVKHAEREFKAAGWDLTTPDFGGKNMQRLMCDQVCELLRVFATHGHSGSSAPYAINLFTSLAKFEPVVPLTGADWEWTELEEGRYQNKRCSHVFKDHDRFEGQAYDIDSIIWRDPDGSCFTNRDSAQPVTFPYTPKREYRDRPTTKHEEP